MTDRFDAVVVGAGLGGLSASAWLAKKGLKTLLLERHNVPGGYATSFVRGRFEFEIALHELSDVGTPENPGGLRRDMDKLGVTRVVEFVQAPNLYRSVFPGLDITLPKGREAYTDALCRQFPADADGIRTFLDRVFSVFSEVSGLGDLQTGGLLEMIPRVATMPFRLKAIPRYMFATWSEILNGDVRDPAARAVISQYWGYFGLPPSRVSFFYFAIALASYVSLGASHIKGRSQALSSGYLDRFESFGGIARMSCGVKRINVKDGEIAGVVTDDGELIEAPVVVSNADPVTVCRDMIGLEKVPSKFIKSLSGMDVALSSINVYMGVDKPWQDFGTGEHEAFINRDFDIDSHYFDGMTAISPAKGLVATLYNPILPDISPPGTSMIVLTTLADGAMWARLPPEYYVEKKNMVAESMLGMAEQIYPGARDRAEVIEVATPITNMRYTGNLGGSIYGFGSTPHNHTVLRMSAKGPVRGLYFTGAWAQPGGGFSPCLMSGKMAAAAVLRDGFSPVKG
jgi:prolycopene isomerase